MSHREADRLINNVEGLDGLLDQLATVAPNPSPVDAPSLYFDIEGVQLGRHGSISIVSLFFLPTATTYLIDVNALGPAAFTTKNWQEYTLRSILEFPGIPKVFFDVRNDSDALFALYGVSLAGVLDLQLMELAANVRYGLYPNKYVSGLARCIERDLPATTELKKEWLKTKEETSRLFDPKKGGSYEIFNQRPISPQVRKYCCQDVAFLPELWKIYSSKLFKGDDFVLRKMVRQGSKDRVKVSQSERYDGQAKNKVVAPWDAEVILDETEDWNNGVMMFVVNGGDTIKEVSFGVFQ